MTIQGSSTPWSTLPSQPCIPCGDGRATAHTRVHACPVLAAGPARTRHNAYLKERVRTWTQNPAHDSKLRFNRRKPISWQNGRKTSRLGPAVSDPTGPAEVADLLRAAGCEPSCVCVQTEQRFPLGPGTVVSVYLSHSDVSPPSLPRDQGLRVHTEGKYVVAVLTGCNHVLGLCIESCPFVVMHRCQR